MRKLLGAVLVIVAALALGYFLLPWKPWLEIKLKSALEEQGLKGISFTLDSVGPQGITLKQITLAGGVPLALDELTIDYTLLQLLNKQFNEIKISRSTLKMNEVEVEMHDGSLRMTPGTNKGEWSIGKVDISREGKTIPTLSGKGTLQTGSGKTDVAGEFVSADGHYKSTFTVHYDSASADANQLVVKALDAPWSGGVISTRDAVFPLGNDKDKTILLSAKGISLDTLMGDLTGERANATGTVSGTIPITIHGDGVITVKAGNLAADTAGTIALSPEAVPGSNQQINLVRDILKDFHYRQFALTMESDSARKLALNLVLEGNNPVIYDGRPVKLNVHLTGDVLSFLEQSVIPLSDPKQLLEQERQ